MDIEETLKERGSRYGEFSEHARITQNIKRAMEDSPNWNSLDDYQKEALEMTAHKIGRILNGDPDYDDSWVDICGYNQLVVDELRKAEQRKLLDNINEAAGLLNKSTYDPTVVIRP